MIALLQPTKPCVQRFNKGVPSISQFASIPSAVVVPRFCFDQPGDV
jgi:hypothetical protein